MIDALSWYERKNKNDKTNLGYGARFDVLFKGVKIFDEGDAVKCKFEVPWWMDNKPQLTNAMNVLKRYHIIPNIHETEDSSDDDYEAYLDYKENAGPKYYKDMRRKRVSPKRVKRVKRCKCK